MFEGRGSILKEVNSNVPFTVIKMLNLSVLCIFRSHRVFNRNEVILPCVYIYDFSISYLYLYLGTMVQDPGKL